MCCADELDPLGHGFVLDERRGDALLDHLLDVVSVVRRAKLDVVVLRRQLDISILLIEAIQFYTNKLVVFVA